MNNFEKIIIAASNAIILISFVSGIVSGNNWNSIEMRILSVASLSLNLAVIEYLLISISKKGVNKNEVN